MYHSPALHELLVLQGALAFRASEDIKREILTIYVSNETLRRHIGLTVTLVIHTSKYPMKMPIE